MEAWTNPQVEFGLLPVMRSLWWGLSPSQRRPCRAGQRHCNTSRPRAGFTLLSPERAWLEKQKGRNKSRRGSNGGSKKRKKTKKKKTTIGEEAILDVNVKRNGGKRSRDEKKGMVHGVSEVTHKIRWTFKYLIYWVNLDKKKKKKIDIEHVQAIWRKRQNKRI